jgi:hypothetical protein
MIKNEKKDERIFFSVKFLKEIGLLQLSLAYFISPLSRTVCVNSCHITFIKISKGCLQLAKFFNA